MTVRENEIFRSHIRRVNAMVIRYGENQDWNKQGDMVTALVVLRDLAKDLNVYISEGDLTCLPRHGAS